VTETLPYENDLNDPDIDVLLGMEVVGRIHYRYKLSCRPGPSYHGASQGYGTTHREGFGMVVSSMGMSSSRSGSRCRRR
jgi:hypothetical protein